MNRNAASGTRPGATIVMASSSPQRVGRRPDRSGARRCFTYTLADATWRVKPNAPVSRGSIGSPSAPRAPPRSRRPAAAGSRFVTSATTASGVMPKWRKSSASGPDAPNVRMPTKPPSSPTKRSQPSFTAASTATRTVPRPSTEAWYAASCSVEVLPARHRDHGGRNALRLQRRPRRERDRDLGSGREQRGTPGTAARHPRSRRRRGRTGSRRCARSAPATAAGGS